MDRPSSPTPFTPPTTEEDRLACLRLIRSRRVGPATFHRLMAAHGNARAALAALPALARAAGETDYAPCPPEAALAELAAAAAVGARLLAFGDPDYPAALADLPDAPPLLWALGDPALLARPMVALVGARNASSLGLRMARRLAEGLGAAGLVVVSGLARGVDAAAHDAALPTGTAAVLAGGIDTIYPPENAALAGRIAAAGLMLTEQPPGLAPQARHFPARNRIVAGLALGVIVVEAAANSGSLITARAALDQNRIVAAVPGHPLDPRATGANALLREGAVLVRDAEDMLAALAPALARAAEEAAARRRSTEQAAQAAQRAAAQRRATAAMRGPGAPPSEGSPPQPPGPGPAPPAAQPHAAGSVAPAPGAPAATLRHRSAPRPSAPAAVADAPTAADAARAAAGQLHRRILDCLGTAPLAEDQLLRDLALPPSAIAPALLDLELDGRIARQPGGLLCRLG